MLQRSFLNTFALNSVHPHSLHLESVAVVVGIVGLDPRDTGGGGGGALFFWVVFATAVGEEIGFAGIGLFVVRRKFIIPNCSSTPPSEYKSATVEVEDSDLVGEEGFGGGRLIVVAGAGESTMVQ